MVSEAIGRLQFTNFSSNSDLEINADITVNGEVISKVIDVPKGSNNSCDIPLSGKTILVKASKNQGTSVMKKSFDLDALTPIAQGGQADSLIGIANSRGDMMPPDPWVPWSGPDDLSVRITSSWDKTSLHLKVKVKDVFFPNRFPEAPCHGDAVQIAIDPKNKGSFYIPTQNSEKLGPDVFEFALALNDDGKSRCVSSHGKNLCVSNNYTITRDEEEKTTNYELHLAWADLGVDPYEGMVLGVSFVVSDGDTGSGATYYAPIGGGVAGQKNPALYKKLILK